MRMGYGKRSVVLGLILVLGLTPLGMGQATAATPSETHVSAASAVPGQGGYREGFRDGFRDGFSDGRDDCYDRGAFDRHRTWQGNRLYVEGYGDGYSSGFFVAEARYCN
ncbi:hypothetical protein ABZ920_11750 [Streptomyces sp. NPDC046831]|uniref:hypothetical protein n=1 Tax=Streptomyces sp. NPDC046831 TaxID=3154805 RepID=UPI0033EA7ED2